jgi:hypothetical protein
MNHSWFQDHENNADASCSNSELAIVSWKRVWNLDVANKWNLDVANKVKVFVWQLTLNSIPVKRNIARRGINLFLLQL